MTTSQALSVMIIASTAGALGLARRSPGVTVRGGRLGHPAAWLGAVTALIYLNQLLFTVYVLRVRHGDPGFIARYLPSGWFTIARWPVIESAARHFPAPSLLAPSVLRVQAFLELPFAMFAYLTVSRWFGGYERARRLAWPAAVAWTAAFCLIEWDLHNPDTSSDLVIRGTACAMVPLVTQRLSRAETDEQARSMPELLAAAASTVALGWLILVVYQTALLYNLGDLPGELPGAVAAAAVLSVARFAAGRLHGGRAGVGVDVIGRTFSWFLVVFFIPAIPIRYGLNFGARYAAGAAALVLGAVAVRDGLARSPGGLRRLAVRMAVCVAAGLGAAYVAALLATGFRETRLLWAAGAFFVTVTVTASLSDR